MYSPHSTEPDKKLKETIFCRINAKKNPLTFKSKFFFVIFLLTGLVISAHASTHSQERLDLSGEWKIKIGDDPAFADPSYDDSTWDRITMPGSMIAYALEKTGKSNGIAWFRKKIHISAKTPNGDLGIILGRIANADVTFFNGEKIGSLGYFPPKEKSMWNFPRHYVISKHLINYEGENLIAIRIWYDTYGEIIGTLALTDEDDWKGDRALSFFLRIISNYIIIAMGLPLLIIFTIFYIRRPESTEYLFYALQLICGFFIVFDLCTFWKFPGGIMTRFKVLGFSWVAINVVHPIFLHRVYNLERPKIEKCLYAYLLLLGIPGLILTNYSTIRVIGTLVIVLSTLIGFYNLSCHISALWLKRPHAKMFSFCGLTVVVGAIHDAFIYLSKFISHKITFLGYSFENMIFPYSAAALYTGTALLLVYRFINLLNMNEDLNENLEKKVEERTRSLILLTEELESTNINLIEIAIRDSLTGLYNHAAFCERLDEIFMTSRRKKFPMSLVMMDIDDFKGFNDSFGHQVGDKILVNISKILKSGTRGYDFIEKHQENSPENSRHYDLTGRYGGDEFMMVLPYCGSAKATAVTERICTEIEKIRIEKHPDLRVTGSFGIAVLNTDVFCSNSERLITLADLALYKSKSMGKNQVCCKIYREN